MNSIDANIVDFILTSATSTPTILVALGLISAILLAFASVTKIGEWVLPKPRETHLSDFLPFERLDEDGSTLHLRNGALARVFEVKGVDSTLMAPEDRASLTSARKRWIDSMAELEVTVRMMTVRDKVRLESMESFKDNKLLHKIDELWMENMHRVFKNHHYVVLSVNDRKEAMRDLDQATNALISIMDMYQPVLLTEREGVNQEDLSPMWVFARLASLFMGNRANI